MNRSILLLPLLALAGAVLLWWRPVDLQTALGWGRLWATEPVAVMAVVLAMALMLSLALPGSVCVWLLAPFHPPWLAALLLTLGSLLGAAGAYALSWRLGEGWRPGATARRLMAVLVHRGDVPTQIALRLLPGFPHAAVNYAGGVLRLPLGGYFLATAIGMGLKWTIYCQAIHGAVEALEQGGRLGAAVFLPLILLSALFLAGAVLRRRWRGQGPPP